MNPEPPPPFPDPWKSDTFNEYTTRCFAWQEKNESLYYQEPSISLSGFYKRPKIAIKKNAYTKTLPDAEETQELYNFLITAYHEQIVPEEIQKWVYDVDIWPAWAAPQIPNPEISDNFLSFETHIIDWADDMQHKIKEQEEKFKSSSLIKHKTDSYLVHGNRDSPASPQHFKFYSPKEMGKVLNLLEVKKTSYSISNTSQFAESNEFYKRVLSMDPCDISEKPINQLFYDYKYGLSENDAFQITTEIYSMLQYGCDGRINHSLLALPAEKLITHPRKLHQMLDLPAFHAMDLVGHSIACIQIADHFLSNPQYLHNSLSYIHTFMQFKTNFSGDSAKPVFSLPNSPLKHVFTTLLYYLDSKILNSVAEFYSPGKYSNVFKKLFKKLDSIVKETVKKEFDSLVAQINSMNNISIGEATAIIGILQMSAKIPSSGHIASANLVSVIILSKIPMCLYSEYCLTIADNPLYSSIMISSMAALCKYNIQLLNDFIIQRITIFTKLKPSPELKRNFNELDWTTYAISSLLGIGSVRSVYLALSIIHFASIGCRVFKPRSWDMISTHLLGLFVAHTEVHKDVNLLVNELKAIKILSAEETNAKFLLASKTSLRFLRFTRDSRPEISRATFKLMANLAVNHTKLFLASLNDTSVRTSVIEGIRSISVPDSFELLDMLTRLIIKYIPRDPRRKETGGSLMKVVQSGPEIVAILSLLREADWTVKITLDRIKSYPNRSQLFPLNHKIADFLEQLKTRTSSAKVILNGVAG